MSKLVTDHRVNLPRFQWSTMRTVGVTAVVTGGKSNAFNSLCSLLDQESVEHFQCDLFCSIHDVVDGFKCINNVFSY